MGIMPPRSMPPPCIIGGMGEAERSCAATPVMLAKSNAAVAAMLRCVGFMRASYVLTLPDRLIFPLAAK
jgi:hypothetical protein